MSRRESLRNGIRLVTEEMPGVPSVTFGLWLENGSRDEQSHENGLSHFLEHLIFKGTERRTAAEISREIDAVGGVLNAVTSKETTGYYAKVLTEHRDVAFDILVDIFRNSRFDADDVERERGVVLQEIAQAEDDPEGHLMDLFHLHCWSPHPLAQPVAGTAETVGRFRRDDVVDFFRARYQPNRTVLAVAGNIRHEDVVRRAEDVLGDLSGRFDAPEDEFPSFRPGLHVVPKPLGQAHLCLGMPAVSCTSRDRFAAYVLNTALGGGTSSRLFQEIREKRGLVYGVDSFLDAYRNAGFLAVGAATARSHVRNVVQLVLEELDRIAQEGLAPDELERTRNQLKGNLFLGLETSDAHMFRIARDEIYFRESFPIDRLLQEIDAVGNDQVMALARRFFQVGEASLVVLGDAPERSELEGLLPT